MIVILFRCTDKGTHPSRELYRIELSAVEPLGTTANEQAMERLSIVASRPGKRHDRVLNTSGDPLPVSPSAALPTVLPFVCPTCRRNRQIKYVDLVGLIETLHAAGVTSVDVSVLPDRLGSN